MDKIFEHNITSQQSLSTLHFRCHPLHFFSKSSFCVAVFNIAGDATAIVTAIRTIKAGNNIFLIFVQYTSLKESYKEEEKYGRHCNNITRNMMLENLVASTFSSLPHGRMR